MSTRLRIATGNFLIVLLALIAPGLAHASGAWTTYIRPYNYTDLLARTDTVWCATLEAGLLRYIRAEDRFEQLTREPGGLASNTVNALAYDRSGRLWAGTPNGASRLSGDERTWDLVNAFDGLPSDSVLTLEADGDTMWIGTPRGLALWNGREIAGAIPDGINPSPFASNKITGIVARGDSLWVSTGAGVYVGRISQNLASWTLSVGGLPNLNVLKLVSDGRDLFALANDTAWRFDFSTGNWIFSGSINSVKRLVDDHGQVIAVSFNGIFRWSGGSWAAITNSIAATGSGDGGVEATVDPLGKGFAATRNGLFEESTPSFVRHDPPAPAGNNIQNVALDGSRTYVATLAEGVGRLDDAGWYNWFPVGLPSSSDTTFRSPSFAFSMVVDWSGRKWVGCWSSAIERFDDHVSPPAFVHYFTTNDTSTFGWSASLDSLGGVWIGGDTPDRGAKEPVGLNHFDVSGNFVRNLRISNSTMTENQVRALSCDRNHIMWVGYAGRGVQTFNPESPSPIFSTVTGTNNLDIFGVEVHGDSAWVMTTSDVRRFNTASRALQSTLTLPASPAPKGACHPMDVGPDGTVWVGTTDGVRAYLPGGATVNYKINNSPLANNEVRAVRVDRTTGVVWFGTAEGLNRFDPQYVPPSAPRLPRLEVTVYPNPAVINGLGVSLSVKGNATGYVGEVYGLDGRLVRRFINASNARVFWDGRDSSGDLVKPGVYFIRFAGGGREAVARVAIVR